VRSIRKGNEIESRHSRTVITAAVALVVLAVVGVVVAVTSSTSSAPRRVSTPPVSVADNPSAIRPITVVGDRIVRDGQPWWFLGYNSFTWSGNCGTADERMTTAEVDAWFGSMRNDGHGAVRLFFQPGWNLQRLDAAVASAKRHGIYVTVTLDDALGECGGSKKNASWFADDQQRNTYRAHLTRVVQRYRGEPTIAWFEYLNEPNDAEGALRPFYDEMGAVARQIDPSRLFASGTIAPYATGGDDQFREITASPGVDIASLHEYDEEEVASNHLDDVVSNSTGKPVLVGEFGITAGDGCDVDFDTRAQRIRAKAQAYIGAGLAGALAWSWQPGDDDCEYENLDADAASQEVLRDFQPRPVPRG